MKNHVVNVLGRQIKVIYKEIDNRYCGLYYNDEGIIEISKSLSREKAHETLIHELVHAVFFRAGLDQTGISHDIQEIICDQVAKVLCENYKFTKKKN